MEKVYICVRNMGYDVLSQPLAVFTDEEKMKLWMNERESVLVFERIINVPITSWYDRQLTQSEGSTDAHQ